MPSSAEAEPAADTAAKQKNTETVPERGCAPLAASPSAQGGVWSTMENVILIVLLTAAVAVGIWYTIRHFKGEGGCCGGGSYRPRKKKLSHVMGEKTFRVEGMHCEHCKARVEEAVNDIHGAAGRADWKKGLLTVLYSQPVDDGQIKQRVEKAGYRITGVL